MKYIFLLIAMSGVLLSCEKTVKIPLPEGKGEIVLNALMNEDSVVYARLTLLSHNQSVVFQEPACAELSLYENDVFKEILYTEERQGLKFYRTNSRVKKGKQYTLKASLPDGVTVEGSDFIPGIARISSTELRVEPDDGKGEKTKLHFTLTDDPAEHNYYRFCIYVYSSKLEGLEKRYFSVDGKNTAGNGLISSEYYDAYFTNDALFDGKDLAFVLNINDRIDSAIMEISSLTESSYKYLKSASLNISQLGNGLFSEAIPVFNNIRNGLGIVGGMAVLKVPVK